MNKIERYKDGVLIEAIPYTEEEIAEREIQLIEPQLRGLWYSWSNSITYKGKEIKIPWVYKACTYNEFEKKYNEWYEETLFPCKECGEITVKKSGFICSKCEFEREQ